MKVSRKFIEALRLHDEPAYRIALRASVHPTILSKLVHGAERVRPDDARIIAIGRELGLTREDCFELSATEEPKVA